MLSRATRRSLSSSKAPTATASATATTQQLQDDDFYLSALRQGKLASHQLEGKVGPAEAVRLRRAHIAASSSSTSHNYRQVTNLPRLGEEFDANDFYAQVAGVNCETVIGFLPLPVGVVGPLRVDGQSYMVPMATTEGALVASTNRGARAIAASEEGCRTAILRDGMTRSPVLAFPSAVAAADFAKWVEQEQPMLAKLFSETTRFGKLTGVKATLAGRNVFLRVRCSTGDAMGMNMVGKGVNRIVERLLQVVPGMELVALSGNTCTDKKPSAVNWIEGRGKSVVAEVFLPEDVVRTVLKTTVHDLCRVSIKKNLVGSSIAGSIGGNNAHAANVVTGIFLATGQDPAQNVCSSNCMTLFESLDSGRVLHASVTMPSLEVGTIGGGTVLPAQSAMLSMLGVKGTDATKEPGANAKRLASIVAASVLAGELSLNAALASNHLISAHMALNRRH